MPFALDSNPSVSEVSEAINYLLGNFGANISADPNTGQIIGPTGQVSGYLYKYMAIKYADSFDGSVNFSNSPTDRLYFGLRNNNDPAESNNHADYIWYQASGGFGVTKSLWYVSTGGRQIQFAVSVSAPDTGWLVDPGSSIDLDVVTSGNIPVIAEAFIPYFTPNTLQVPRAGDPLAPVFTNIVPVMYATDAGAVVPFTDAQTDTAVNFLNNTWRIGNSSTTGNGDISYTNITIGNPTDAGDYAQWPSPTAMSASPAYITVPVRYKNSSGVVAQAGVATVQLVFTDPGLTGQPGPTVEINGYTAFVQNAGGAFTPPSATLSAVTANITAPTYSWTISGATPTTATTASVVVTPTGSSTGVDVSLTVNGSNLTSPITKTVEMPVVYDGAPGEAGANGLMSAFPSIYIWTGSSTPPTRPTTTSTYTWSAGTYTAPSGWATSAPSNTVAGNYLWIITVPLNVSATTLTSTLDWTNVTYPIRAIAYNGANGANGTDGTDGTNGANGSATFVVTRTANDSSPPSNAEVVAVIGRNPVAGDIVTVSYNIGNNAVVYRYTTNWVTQATYLTGSLIVQNTITADKMVTGVMSADNTLTRGLTVRDNSGNILLSSGTPLNFANITAAPGWLNSNIAISGGTIIGIGSGAGTAVANSSISINSNGTLSGAGGGAVTPAGINAVNVNLSNAPAGILNSNVTLGTLGAGGFAYLSQITSANATTYIAGAAIGTAQVGVLTAGNIGAGTIDATKIAANTITAGQIAASSITGDRIAASTITAGNIAANTITASQIASGTITATQIASSTITATQIAANTITAGQIAASTITATQIAASSITADKLSVSQLAAVSANTGNLTVTGTFQSNTATISGTTMTGSGGVLYSNGLFAFGNSSTNISYNGSQMTLNGNVVTTANINLNAVTSISSATGSGTVSISASLAAGDTVVILTVADSTLLSINQRQGSDQIKVGSTVIKSVNSYFGNYTDALDNGYSVFPATTIAANYSAPSTTSYTFTGVTAAANFVSSPITIILLVTKR